MSPLPSDLVSIKATSEILFEPAQREQGYSPKLREERRGNYRFHGSGSLVKRFSMGRPAEVVGLLVVIRGSDYEV